MAKKKKSFRPKARLPKGMRDIEAGEIRILNDMLAKIARVYDGYGFEPLETPAFEYTEALGKFLPDQERPNAGVFSFQDEDEAWVSLRYDLTAPLARHVAEHYDRLAKPFRRYASGPVWRNEKPGPGRFRQFMQFDADTVGTPSIAADAELCMLAADVMEALGIKRGDYVIKVNNRKVLDGVMQSIGLDGDDNAERRLIVLRAIDKLDRLGVDGVTALLGKGRKDDSGDFTRGADLSAAQCEKVISYISLGQSGSGLATVSHLRKLFADSAAGEAGLDELHELTALVESAGYDRERICIDTSIVRGLEYYTGPVFEAELTFAASDDSDTDSNSKDHKGRPLRFGSVGGGGRYDGLVARFKGIEVPATGFSIGVSRLASALMHQGLAAKTRIPGPVVVLVMDFEQLPRYQKMARELRAAGIRAEMYLGTSGMKAQMKYADKRASPCVIIQGEDEIAKGQVQIKDLVEGARLSKTIKTSQEWREARPAQFEVDASRMIAAVRDVLSRHVD